MLQRYSTCSLGKRSKGFSNSSISFLSYSSPYFGLWLERMLLIHQILKLKKNAEWTDYFCICVLPQVDLHIIGRPWWLVGVDCFVLWNAFWKWAARQVEMRVASYFPYYGLTYTLGLGCLPFPARWLDNKFCILLYLNLFYGADYVFFSLSANFSASNAIWNRTRNVVWHSS